MRVKLYWVAALWAVAACGPESAPNLTHHWVVGEYSSRDAFTNYNAAGSDDDGVRRYTFRTDGVVDVESDGSCGGRPDRVRRWSLAWEPEGEHEVRLRVTEELGPLPHGLPTDNPKEWVVTRDVQWESPPVPSKASASGPCKALGMRSETPATGFVSGTGALFRGHVCLRHEYLPCEVAGEPATCDVCHQSWCDGEPPACLEE